MSIESQDIASTGQQPPSRHRTGNRNATTSRPGETSPDGSDSRASDASTDEADTPRDGFASYPAEVHALTHGLYMGFTTQPLRRPPEPNNADVKKESHYYRGGYLGGTALQVLVLVVLSVVAEGTI